MPVRGPYRCGRAVTSAQTVCVALMPGVLTAPPLVLRRWDVVDAAVVVSAIQVSIEALSTWIPWFVGGVPTVESERAVFEAGATEFDRDIDWAYSMFEKTTAELVGSCALHSQDGGSVLEIG
jgi:hypothetical protein